MKYDAIVLGAGAAGLFCAAVAGQRGRKIVVVERNREAGRKILISGGGRCNFTNVHSRPEHFLSSNPPFVRSALARAGAGHPDEALTALMPALERTTDPEILTLAAKLAIADVARRPAAEQRERLPQLRDLSSRLGAGKGDASPVLARWIAYLESQTP